MFALGIATGVAGTIILIALVMAFLDWELNRIEARDE